MTQKLKVLELFSGIGAASKALKNIGVDEDLVDSVEIDKYAVKSFNAIHETNFEPQDIIKWDKDVEADVIIHGSPCFTADTLVLTDKGYKKIVEITDEDLVVDKNGDYQKNSGVFYTGDRQIYSVKAMGLDETKTTANHLFYARKMSRKWDNKNRSYKRVFTEPSWVRADELDKTHYLGFPVNARAIVPKWEGAEYTRGNETYTKSELDMADPELWYLAGRYLADGWVRIRHERNGNISGVAICCGKHKKEDFESHLSGKYHYTLAEERTVYEYQFLNKELGVFLSQFGRGALNKKIPGFALDLPPYLAGELLRGYLDADGSVKNKKFKATSVSRELIYGVAQLVAKVYHRPISIWKNNRPNKWVIEGRIVNQHPTYELSFKEDLGKQDQAFYEDGYVWYPIRGIEATNKIESVYDLTVEDTHSFVANGAIVHNCQDFSIAGKQAGGDDGSGTRSSLMYETLRIVEKLKPKYVIWENVKNILSKKHKHNFDVYIEQMDKLGYNSFYKVLNAKDFGVPQNRERVYTISIRKDLDQSFEFPEGKPLTIRLKDILEKNVDEKFYLTDEQIKRIKTSTSFMRNEKVRVQDPEGVSRTLVACDYKDPKCVRIASRWGNHQAGQFYDKDGLSPTLDTGQGGSRTPMFVERGSIGVKTGLFAIKEPQAVKRRRTEYGKEVRKAYENHELEHSEEMKESYLADDGIMPTLTASRREQRVAEPQGKMIIGSTQAHAAANKDVVSPTLTSAMGDGGGQVPIYNYDLRIRKLTPLETYRLMAFDDEDFYKAQKVCSNSQLYKQAGNSIVVKVLEAIFKNLIPKEYYKEENAKS